MAVLVGGQTWGLSTSKNRNKSVVLLKLTDASLRALEDHLQNETHFPSSQDSTNSIRKPTIKFPSGQQELGSFSIPIGSDGKEANFSFSIKSSNDEAQGPKGSLECLSSQQIGSLESIGVVQEKIHVQASDDTYTRFGQKMVEAKKESEKRTTQFLDRRPTARSSAVNNRRDKFMRQIPNPANSAPAKNSFQFQHGSSRDRSSAIAKSHHHLHHRAGSSSGSNGHQHQAGFVPSTHPMLDRNAKTSRTCHINPDLMRRPLKERIIHLLAVRPFKKPELLSRISRDGVLEKDKKNITTILKQVSMMKDNTYHLLRHIWNDVSEDWPFYTEQDKQSFRRRKPQNLTPPCSDGSTSSSGHSPSSTHPASPPPPVSSSSPLKRQYYGMHQDVDNGLAAKKKRVSNYVRPPDLQNRIYSPASNSGYSDMVSGSRSPVVGGGLKPSPARSPMNHGYVIQQQQQQQQQHQTERNAATTKQEQTENSFVINSDNETKFWTREDGQEDQVDDGHGVSLNTSSSENGSVIRKLAKEYTTITSKEQRTQYKKEFNDHYNKYRHLHSELEKVSRKFADLEERLNQVEHGTAAHMKLRSQIMLEYKLSKRNKNFIRSKAEFAVLHDKLAHIKKLVHEYDVSIAGHNRNDTANSQTLITSSS